jgi:hyperosmotically inducible protein
MHASTLTRYRGALVAALGLSLALPVVAAGQAQTSPAQSAPRTPAPTASAQAAPRTQAERVADAEDMLDDQITFRLETHDVLRKYDIDVDVDGTTVTLSGDVANAAQEKQALALAKVEGVTTVTDDIDIDADVDVTLADRAKRGLSKTGEAISDTWINTKVSWFFVGEDVLDDSNINVDTDAGVVTLKGTVLSEAGRTRALALARRTEGVKDVRDQLTIAPAR